VWRTCAGFLLILTAHRRRRRLTAEREHRHVIVLRIVEAVEQMDRTRARRAETDAEFARELRVRGRHERRLLFMPHLHEFEPVGGPVDRGDDAVDAVARIAVDAPNAPRKEAFDQEIADGHERVVPGGALTPNGLRSRLPCRRRCAR
jgi:hypothetical protein